MNEKASFGMLFYLERKNEEIFGFRALFNVF